MATKLVYPSIADSHVNLPISKALTIAKLRGLVSAGIRSTSKTNISRFFETPFCFKPLTIVKVAEQSSDLYGDETLVQNKAALYKAVKGISTSIILLEYA